MKLSENPTIKKITFQAAKMKKAVLRSKKTHRRNRRDKSKNEELNYQVYAYLLDLKKDEEYIQIDNQPTFWECRDDTDGLLVHANVKNVVYKNKALIVYPKDSVQKYRYNEELECFEKLLH